MRNNYDFTEEAGALALSRSARFVYASPPRPTVTGLKAWMTGPGDLDSLRPLNMYGYSKHLFDLYARKQGILDQIVGLKDFNVSAPTRITRATCAAW